MRSVNVIIMLKKCIYSLGVFTVFKNSPNSDIDAVSLETCIISAVL